MGQQSNIMKAFAVAAFFTTVLAAPQPEADAQVPFTAFASGPLPAAPVHHAVHAAPVAHHAVHHAAPVAHHAVHHAPVAHHAVHHAAPVVHHAAHHAVAHHAVAHHAVVHAPVHHAYHAPKHNCSVVDVVESAEVCTPAFETVCETIEVPTKKIIDVEQCYPVTRTVCSESVEVIDNEICVYSYSQKVVATTTDTTTARRSPRRLATTSPLSLRTSRMSRL